MQRGRDDNRLWVREMHKCRTENRREVRIQIPELRLHRGELAVVLGANGSGKSTLLDMLGLILSPDQLERYVLYADGRQIDLRHLSQQQRTVIRRHHFAYVLQTGGLLEFLTIAENIRLAARLRGKPLIKIIEIARSLDIEGILGKYPGRASGGQRQKAALARALVQEPEIILADEPTAELDTLSARGLISTFRELTRGLDSSVLMVTHDRELVRDYADTMYHFNIVSTETGRLVSTLEPGPPPS